MNAFLSSEVPDPSDFPPHTEAPGLRSLDSSFRCTICGELFDGPVTLPCGHCFCSCCIRNAMVLKQECPSCRKVYNEGHLRPNPGMEESISAWKAARPYVLKLSQEDQDRRKQPEHSKSKKRKWDADSNRSSSRGSSEIECIPGPSRNTSANSAPHSPSKMRKSSKLKKRAVSVNDDNEIHVATSDIDEEEINPISGIVSCPICQKSVRMKDINRHIDKNCDQLSVVEGTNESRSKKSQWMQIMSGPNKGKDKDTDGLEDSFPLPKASYGTLKDKKIREMLLEHELPTTGERNVMIQRHQQWVILYNANLDKSSTNRKNKRELRKELKQWEDEKNKKKRNIVDDVVMYEKTQKSEFAKLVELARPTANKEPPPPNDPAFVGDGVEEHFLSTAVVQA